MHLHKDFAVIHTIWAGGVYCKDSDKYRESPGEKRSPLVIFPETRPEYQSSLQHAAKEAKEQQHYAADGVHQDRTQARDLRHYSLFSLMSAKLTLFTLLFIIFVKFRHFLYQLDIIFSNLV